MRWETKIWYNVRMKMTETPPDFSSLLRNIAGSRRIFDVLPDISGNQQVDAGYFHWEELRRRTPPNDLTTEEWWCAIKLGRHAQKRKLPIPYGENGFFWWTMADSLIQRLHEIDIRSGVVVRNDSRPLVEYTARHSRETSPLFESVMSSQLEGSPTTWADAREMIRTGRKPRDVGERMTLNNFRAMREIVRTHDAPLTPRFILELHGILTEDTLEKHDAAGRYRTDGENVRVADGEGTVFHTPPPASRLPGDMEKLCAFANGALETGSYMPDIVRAILLHFWIGYEHPFVDGNGRTARAIMYWSLLRSGYRLFEYVSISNILKRSPSKYVRAFTYAETDEGDATYFLLHQTEAILRALDEFKAYAERKARETENAELALANSGLTLRQRTIAAYAMRHPGKPVFIADGQRLCGVSYATARIDLMALERLGFVEMRKEGHSFAYYPVSGIGEGIMGRSIADGTQTLFP